jgi:type I restriction enzyme S subunit
MSLPSYKEYKDSGVQWLGKIPSHWELVIVKRIFTRRKSLNEGMKCNNRLSLTLSGVLRRSLDDTEGLQASEFETYQIFEKNDLVFKLIDLQNIQTSRVGLVPEKGIMSPAYIRLEPNIKKTDPKYAYWFFTYLYKFNVFNELGGGVRQTLGQEELLSLKYISPDFFTQTVISSFLDRETSKIDSLISEQEKLIELLKEKRQAIISHAVTKGLNPDVEMKDSGVEWLGKVPKHWAIVSCRGIVCERTAKNDGAKCQDYLSLMANMGIIPYAEKGDVGNKKPEDLTKCKVVKRGDFVINSMNYGIGSYGLSDYDGVCSPVYIVLKPQNDVIESRFAFRIFENRAFQTFAQSFGNGILEHRCAINWDILKTIGVGVPPMDEQRAILAFLDHETAKIDELTIETYKVIELLKERRSALISAAVTGQIDVRNFVPKEAA